jgi:shikimate dehydrogenase
VIDGSSRVFALLGDPVAHSLSPTMQNAAFLALGLPAVYVPLRCGPQDLGSLMRGVARAGGGGNITIPYKELAAAEVEVCSAIASSVGACNTFWLDDGRIRGDNTDVEGLLAALDHLAPPKSPWLVAGTGGSARAVVVAAAQRGAPLAICSRSEARRRAFEQWAVARGATLAPAEGAKVLINATPLGLRAGDPLPLSVAGTRQAEVALDLVYAPGGTRWVSAMRAAGLRASDGRAMLVAQGAAALERWFPGTDAPTEIMRAAVDAALH